MAQGVMSTAQIEEYLRLAERKALVSLAAGKWDRFGYWAAHSVHLRKILGLTATPSPFARFAKLAERILGADTQPEIAWVAAQDDPVAPIASGAWQGEEGK